MKERIVTGIIGGVLFVSMVLLGGAFFNLFIMLVATVAMIELLKMKMIEPLTLKGIIGLISMWVILVPIKWFELVFLEDVTKFHVFACGIIILLALTVITKNKFSFDQVGFILLSSIYIGFGFHLLMTTRGFPGNGMLLVFFFLFIIWTTDSAAYFVGRKWGKHKLASQISPKKTIEGSIGGIVGAVIVGMLFFTIFPTVSSNYGTALLMTIIVSVFGQLGDLVQSAFKRHYGVKDSGKILPGHGGILDRFDSLIYVMFILYIFQFI